MYLKGQNNEFLQAQGYTHHDKSQFSNLGLKDNVLRIGIIDPKASPEHIGHIYWVLNGLTMESHSTKGVDRRAWNTPVLQSQTTDIYVIEL